MPSLNTQCLPHIPHTPSPLSPRYELQEASLQSLMEQLPLLSMSPVMTSSNTPPLAHIPEVTLSECDPTASLGDGSVSLPRSLVESGCSSLDTLLEDTEGGEVSDPEGEDGQYLCPVYQGGPSGTPGPPVLMVPLPAGPHGADYWIQRRVAMYLSQHWNPPHRLFHFIGRSIKSRSAGVILKLYLALVRPNRNYLVQTSRPFVASLYFYVVNVFLWMVCVAWLSVIFVLSGLCSVC